MTHLVELLNPSNQVRIAGGVLKIDVICRRGWGRTGKIRRGGRARAPGGKSDLSGPKRDKGPGRRDAEMWKWTLRKQGCPPPVPHLILKSDLHSDVRLNKVMRSKGSPTVPTT